MGASTLFHDGHGFYEHHISAAGGFGPLQRCKVWQVMKELHAGGLEREAASTSVFIQYKSKVSSTGDPVGVTYELLSKLLVSHLISAIVVPYI